MAIFKSMFKKTGYIKIGSQPEEKGPSVPDGMWLIRHQENGILKLI